MPGSTVVEPKIVRDVGTDVRVSVIEARADLGVLDVDGRRRAADRDRFLQRRELHRGVDGDRLPDGHDDALADERREAASSNVSL